MGAWRRLLLAVLLVGLVLLLAFLAVRLQVSAPTITLTTAGLYIVLGWLVLTTAFQHENRGVLIASVVVLVVALVPSLWFIAGPTSYAVNTWRLSVFQQQFLSSPPPGTTPELLNSEVGVLTGNGNHCDFVVSLSFSAPVDRSAVLAHYQSLHIKRAVPGESSQLLFTFSEAKPPVLTISDAPNSPAFDPRCH